MRIALLYLGTIITIGCGSSNKHKVEGDTDVNLNVNLTICDSKAGSTPVYNTPDLKRECIDKVLAMRPCQTSN